MVIDVGAQLIAHVPERRFRVVAPAFANEDSCNEDDVPVQDRRAGALAFAGYQGRLASSWTKRLEDAMYGGMRSVSSDGRCIVLSLAISAGILALGCGRKPEPPKRKPGPAATASAVATPSAAPPLRPVRPSHPAEQLLMAWSDALNRHSADELIPFYSAHVVFYGQRKSAAEVVAAKRRAFEQVPSYQQRVSNVHIEKSPHGFVLRFDKRSGAQLESNVTARLVLETNADRSTISEESDSPTDARFGQTVASTCGDAVFRVVGKQPSIASDIARVAREDPGVNPGGMSYVELPNLVQASQGYFHEDHYEPRWWIDAANGVLKLRDAYSDELLPVAPGEAAVIARLCTGSSDAGD